MRQLPQVQDISNKDCKFYRVYKCKFKLKTEKDLEIKCKAENSLNTKVKEEDAKKGIKSEANTDDVKIKDKYKVCSNCKVHESKRILNLK